MESISGEKVFMPGDIIVDKTRPIPEHLRERANTTIVDAEFSPAQPKVFVGENFAQRVSDAGNFDALRSQEEVSNLENQAEQIAVPSVDVGQDVNDLPIGTPDSEVLAAMGVQKEEPIQDMIDNVSDALSPTDRLKEINNIKALESNSQNKYGVVIGKVEKSAKIPGALHKMINNKSESSPDAKWSVPKNVTEYVDALCADNKKNPNRVKLLHLAYELKGNTDKDQVKSLIYNAGDNGDTTRPEGPDNQKGIVRCLTEQQRDELEAMLDDGEVVSVSQPEDVVLEDQVVVDGVIETPQTFAQPITAQPVETISVSTIEKPPEISILSEKELREKLIQAEDAYVVEEVKYKNALREKKSLFAKTMSDLGFAGKQMPEPGTMNEFLHYFDAKKDYTNAQVDLRLKMLERGEIGPLNKNESRLIDEGLISERESQRDRLQRKINEALPQLEKGFITKTFEKWARWPLPARVALSTAFLTGVGVTFGSIAAASALGVGGYRIARGVIGGFGSQIAGKKVDSILKKKTAVRKENALEEYVGGTFDRDSLVENEEKMQKFLESEVSQKKRDLLKKAGVMMATGAGVSVGLGLAGLNESQFGVGTVHAAESHVGSVSEFQPVRVELSSKGFIDTFSKLQQELAGKYPNIHHAPPQVAEILDSSPEKLAEKFGLYKPGSEFQSGFGLKGEHLAFDKSGNLIFEHIKGNQTLLDAKTGLIHEYKGTMFDAQSGKLSVKPVLEAQPVVESHASSVIDQTNTGAATISEASSESLAEAAANGALTTEIPTNVDANTKIFGFSGKDALADTATLGLSVAPDVVAKETIQTVPENLFMVDGVPTDAFSGKVSIDALISGGAPLIDKYQFDTSKEAKEARKQYAIAFEKLYMKAPDGLVDNRWRIDGSLGLQLLQTGNDLTVLLNGKKIGTGSVNQNGQVGMQYEEALGKGLFGVKNPYQLAFEKATKVAKEKVKPVNKHQ